MRRVALTLVTLSAVLGMAAPTALASRAPTASERAALAHALGVPQRCLKLRMSTVQRGWARVALKRVTGSCARYAADGLAIYRRSGHAWHPRFAGSSWACPIRGVPEAVRKDLKVPCPEGGG